MTDGTDRDQVVEEAARAINRWREAQAEEYRRNVEVEATASEIIDEATETDREWAQLCRKALRRARELRGEDPNPGPEGVAPKYRTESNLQPQSSVRKQRGFPTTQSP